VVTKFAVPYFGDIWWEI